MSRKTVPFKMPGSRAGGYEPGAKFPERAEAPDPRLPASGAADDKAASHDWVHSGDAVPSSSEASTPDMRPASVVVNRPIPDVSAMWNLWEITVLLISLPSLLGSFWLLNFYQAKFAARSGRELS